MAKGRGIFTLGIDCWDPTHRFETSWLFSPWVLGGIRALISLYSFTTLFFIIGYTCANSSFGGCETVRRSFSYFTVLTYWGLAFYFLASAIHTLSYARHHHAQSRRQREGRGEQQIGENSPVRAMCLLDSFPRGLQALHSLFYTTIVTLPLLVTIVYWGVLYKNPWFAREFDAWHNVSQHALNSGFALFEIVFARTEMYPWVHLLWLLVILLGYLCVAYITAATQGWYTYTFLDHDVIGGRGHVAAYVFGIAIGIVVVFLVVRGLIWLRRWLTEVKLGMGGTEGGEYIDAEMSTR
ncbi:hypothetical protein E4U13_004471 [Claviceps humidiphila]|uniref:FAR-17a/AIG1-like protein n=1 Tax=Claviceps humidiphila TaxID=1294629 RepID=A0A9P7Q1G6_9HYPO|nr:hypothetical protein E4U13_004471 [Claviceps humidiphila]